MKVHRKGCSSDTEVAGRYKLHNLSRIILYTITNITCTENSVKKPWDHDQNATIKNPQAPPRQRYELSVHMDGWKQQPSDIRKVSNRTRAGTLQPHANRHADTSTHMWYRTRMHKLRVEKLASLAWSAGNGKMNVNRSGVRDFTRSTFAYRGCL